MTEIFDRIVAPVANPDDARATCRALSRYPVGSVAVIHVIEKAGGAPDKASVEQREEYAEEIFDAARETLAETGLDRVETDVVFGTDVADAIFDAADDHDATAIVITPQGGSRWVRLLTGDVALSLVTETDRPVVVLPDIESGISENSADEHPDPETADTDERPADETAGGDGSGGSAGE
mgnify:CR=1 FL=1